MYLFWLNSLVGTNFFWYPLKKSPQNSAAVSLKLIAVTISYYYNMFRKLIVNDTLRNIKNDILGGEDKKASVILQ